MKATKIIFWSSTTLIFLMEGLMPALFSHTELAKEGIRHLGYPAYFGVALTFFKVAGAVCLMLPMLPARVKEWAYACFMVEFFFAALSHFVVDGFDGNTVFPLVLMAVLAVSYVSFHRLQAAQTITA